MNDPDDTHFNPIDFGIKVDGKDDLSDATNGQCFGLTV